MTKHSPGPWKHSDKKDYTIVDVSGNLVCEYYIAESSEHIDLANARLITAAPELLEALEILTIQCSDFTNDGQGAAKFHPYNIAMATLIKAKGQSLESDEDKGYIPADPSTESKTERNDK